MGSSVRKRLALFRRGVAAYQQLTGDSRELYFCPLCTTAFERADAESGRLTLEDVPPKSRGGRPLLLTCKSCNDRSGHELDCEADIREDQSRFIEALALHQGEYEGRVTVSVAGKELNADATVSKGKVMLRVVRQINNPSASQEVQSYFTQLAAERQGVGEEYRISLPRRFHVRRSKLSDLRAAYLLAFAAFGYRYAFDRRLDPIREQIGNPGREILSGFWFAPPTAARDQFAWIDVAQPRCYVVQFGRSGALLPQLDSPDDLYEQLARDHQKGEQVNFTGQRLRWPTTLHAILDFAARSS